MPFGKGGKDHKAKKKTKAHFKHQRKHVRDARQAARPPPIDTEASEEYSNIAYAVHHAAHNSEEDSDNEDWILDEEEISSEESFDEYKDSDEDYFSDDENSYKDYLSDDDEGSIMDQISAADPAPNKKRKSMKEKLAEGLHVCNQRMMRSYVVVAFCMRFEASPEKSDWSEYANQLQNEIGMNKRSILNIFDKCLNGDRSPEKQKPGAGRRMKLEANNVGLRAGALALASGFPPKMATAICNAENKKHTEPGKIAVTVVPNTFMRALRTYTDVVKVSTQRRKTGSKDPDGFWAIARVVLAKQILHQKSLGEQIDSGQQVTISPGEAPPLWWDGILWADENHVRQVLGGNGHESSFSSHQYLVAMNPLNGILKRLRDGGKQQVRKQKTVPKYAQEARACYGVAVPEVNGKKCPEMIEPWSYTGRKLVSLKVWNEKKRAEWKKTKRAKDRTMEAV